MSSVRLLVKEQDGTVGVSLQRDGYLDADPTVFAPFESPLSDTDREDLRWYLEDYLVHPYAVWQEDGERIAGQLDGWGTALFNALIGEGKPGRDAYVKAREAETWPELMLVSRSAGFLALPWELLKDPARTTPLALDFAGITRTIATEAKAAEMVTGETLRVLMVIARPRGEKDVGYQMVARPLLSRLAAVRGTVALEVLRPPTLEALQARLNAAVSAGEPFHILHFDGHGAFGVKAPTEFSPNQYKAAAQGFLAFEQANGEKHLVSAADFALVLNRARVPLLVLNACQSGTLQEGVEAQAGTATRVLEAGAAAVVAMGYSVYAVAAAEFMTAFYDALFRGEALAQAVAEGRKRMKTRPERPSPKGDLPLDDWLVPVLYARRAIDFGHLKPAPRQPAALSLEAELDRVRGRPAAAAAGSDPLAPVDGVFFGRDAAFYRLERTLRLKRAVVIQGLGGSGKTELAKAFARWLRDSGGLDRADFIHFHSFEPGLPSFGLDGVVTEIGMALFGTDFVGKTEGPEQRRKLVLNVLREHRMLLVWDNFESVRSMPAETTPPLD
ncbi:MAG: CHAT domain-containing protein, partial [Alphaproteobacteria bacterium]|nr:CHAT domain-containing protein [Alphaproteobacteria bacterium]